MPVRFRLEKGPDRRVGEQEALRGNEKASAVAAQHARTEHRLAVAEDARRPRRAETGLRLPEVDPFGRTQPREEVLVEPVALREPLGPARRTVDVGRDRGDVPLPRRAVERMGRRTYAEVLRPLPVGRRCGAPGNPAARSSTPRSARSRPARGRRAPSGTPVRSSPRRRAACGRARPCGRTPYPAPPSNDMPKHAVRPIRASHRANGGAHPRRTPARRRSGRRRCCRSPHAAPHGSPPRPVRPYGAGSSAADSRRRTTARRSKAGRRPPRAARRGTPPSDRRDWPRASSPPPPCSRTARRHASEAPPRRLRAAARGFRRRNSGCAPPRRPDSRDGPPIRGGAPPRGHPCAPARRSCKNRSRRRYACRKVCENRFRPSSFGCAKRSSAPGRPAATRYPPRSGRREPATHKPGRNSRLSKISIIFRIAASPAPLFTRRHPPAARISRFRHSRPSPQHTPPLLPLRHPQPRAARLLPAASTHRPRSRLSPQDTLPPHAPPHSPIPVPRPNPSPAQPPSYSRIRPTAPSPTTVDPAPRPQGPQRPHLPSPPDPITASPRHTCCTAPSSRLRHTLRRYPQPPAVTRPITASPPQSRPTNPSHPTKTAPDARPAPYDRYAREPPDAPRRLPGRNPSNPARGGTHEKNSASELLVFSQI